MLRGLTHVGYDDVAADIGRNYHSAVVRCYETTGTVWENMAPEHNSGGEPVPGDPAKADFVGWGALGPIAVLFEYVFGIRASVPEATITWDVRLTDRHGIRRYPFGESGTVDLEVDARRDVGQEPRVTITSNVALRLVLRWGKSASRIGGIRPNRASVPREPLHEVSVARVLTLRLPAISPTPPTPHTTNIAAHYYRHCRCCGPAKLSLSLAIGALHWQFRARGTHFTACTRAYCCTVLL